MIVFFFIVGYNQLTFFFKRKKKGGSLTGRRVGSHIFSLERRKEMSGSFKARGNLTDCNGNSHRQKKGATFTSLTCCLQKAAILLGSSTNDVFYTGCVCQKIHSICWQIMDTYGDEIPTVITNSRPPEELIEAVKSRVASDGTIGSAARAEIIAGLNAVLAMMNG